MPTSYSAGPRLTRRLVVAGALSALSAPFIIGRAAASVRSVAGEAGGANFAIEVPANWNGALLVYAHPYRMIEDPRSAVPHVTFAPAEAAYFPDLAPALLSRGYALAGAAFRRQGYAVREGIEDCAATVGEFRKLIGVPGRTIIYGTSLGSFMALEAAENRPDLYQGAMMLSGLSAGGARIWDRVLDFALAYDAAFGWPASWGRPEKVRPDIAFGRDVMPVLREKLSDPRNRGGFEFMRAIGDFPEKGYYDGRMPSPWLFGNMFFATYGAAELAKRAGGNALRSASRPYVLDAEQTAGVAKAGGDPAALLAAINLPARRIEAQPTARAYLDANYTPTGDLKIPTLSLHAIHDGFAPVSNETVLKEVVKKAGRSERLAQAYTETVGHNAFSEAQMIAGFAALDRWIETGAKPGQDALGPTDGFLPDFQPPPWPR